MRIFIIMIQIEEIVTVSTFVIRHIRSIVVEFHFGIESRGQTLPVEVISSGNLRLFSGIWMDLFRVLEFRIRKLFQNQICTKSEMRTRIGIVQQFIQT